MKYFFRNIFSLALNDFNNTPGWRQNLDKSQRTGAIDSANNVVLSLDLKM